MRNCTPSARVPASDSMSMPHRWHDPPCPSMAAGRSHHGQTKCTRTCASDIIRNPSCRQRSWRRVGAWQRFCFFSTNKPHTHNRCRRQVVLRVPNNEAGARGLHPNGHRRCVAAAAALVGRQRGHLHVAVRLPAPNGKEGVHQHQELHARHDHLERRHIALAEPDAEEGALDRRPRRGQRQDRAGLPVRTGGGHELQHGQDAPRLEPRPPVEADGDEPHQRSQTARQTDAGPHHGHEAEVFPRAQGARVPRPRRRLGGHPREASVGGGRDSEHTRVRRASGTHRSPKASAIVRHWSSTTSPHAPGSSDITCCSVGTRTWPRATLLATPI